MKCMQYHEKKLVKSFLKNIQRFLLLPHKLKHVHDTIHINSDKDTMNGKQSDLFPDIYRFMLQ